MKFCRILLIALTLNIIVGAINSATRSAVMNLNGHSLATTQSYYVHRNLNDDVTQANNAFPQYTPNSQYTLQHNPAPQPQEEMEEQPFMEMVTLSAPVPLNHVALTNSPARVLDYSDWGLEHPHHKSKNTGRIPWTIEEKEWIHNWWMVNPTLPASQCLRKIRESAASRCIFHQHHTQDSTRVDYGLKRVKEEAAAAEAAAVAAAAL